MFLRNYDNYLVALNLCTASSSGYEGLAVGNLGWGAISGFEDDQYNQRAANGTVSKVYICGNSGYMGPPIMLTPINICLGTGNIAVNYDDYCLSGEVIPNKLVAISSTTAQYNATTHTWTKQLSATYSNTTEEVISIAEWGLWRANVSSVGNQSFSHTSSNSVLTYREVLDEPIVIEPGTTTTLTFSIIIPMANHP